MIEVNDNERLDISIENANYEFNKSSFFKKIGLVAAGSLAITTGVLYGCTPEAMSFVDAATYGLCAMGGITATYGIINGINAKKSINDSKKANAKIKSLSKTAEDLGLEKTEKMEQALKDSEIVTISNSKKIDGTTVEEKYTQYIFASPETSVVDEHKYTYIFRQETNYSYNDGILNNTNVGKVGIVESEDFNNPEYADDLKLATNRMTGNLTRKKIR